MEVKLETKVVKSVLAPMILVCTHMCITFHPSVIVLSSVHDTIDEISPLITPRALHPRLQRHPSMLLALWGCLPAGPEQAVRILRLALRICQPCAFKKLDTKVLMQTFTHIHQYHIRASSQSL